jgi:hypothetical protein
MPPSNLFESLCGHVTELVNGLLVDIGTYYYPSADGLDMEGFDDLSLQYLLDSTDDGVTTLTIEATNDDDPSSPQWDDLTKAFTKTLDGTTATSYASTGAAIQGLLEKKDFNVQRVRVKIVIAGHTAAVLKIHARQKAF